MDHETRAEAADRHNPETAARIVRRIADIERDFGLAYGPLSGDLSREIVKAMGKAIADPWQFFEGEWAATMMLAGWKSARGVNQMDAYLEFGQVAAEEYDACTWIGAAVGTGPARLGLELKVRRGLVELAQKAFGNVTKVKGLLDAGFVRDEGNERLYVPIVIPTELLAQSCEQNDLTEAVAPAASRETRGALTVGRECPTSHQQVWPIRSHMTTFPAHPAIPQGRAARDLIKNDFETLTLNLHR